MSPIAYSREKQYKLIDDKKQLFFDDDLVDVVKNIKRTYHEPVKHPENPMIEQDKPWEDLVYFRCNTFNVLYDEVEKTFKCFYEDLGERAMPDEIKESWPTRVLLAVSEDGIHWEKKPLGRFSKDGHDTNIVFGDPSYGAVHAATFLLDPTETDPAKRYKTLYCNSKEGGNIPKRSTMRDATAAGLSIAYSENGIEWKPDEGNPIITEFGSDVEILTYDPIDKIYVLMGRADCTWWSPHPEFDRWYAPYWPKQPEGYFVPKRLIYRMESADCMDWSEPALVFAPGPEDNIEDHHYGLTHWRVDDYYVGILNILHQVENTFDIELVYSMDGLDWNRFPGHKPLIPRGGPGSFDEFMLECPTVPLVVGDEEWIYYAGNSCHHDLWIPGPSQPPEVPEAQDRSLVQHHLGLATIRLDGWVSLDALVREGYVETVPVYSTGSSLTINARCNPGGYVACEIMDNWGNVWDGFRREDCDTFTGDEVNHTLSWKGRTDVNSIPGITKIKFYMKSAELYSFSFAGG